MIRLLKEANKKPKYVIFENVAMIKSKKFKDTLNLFKEDLINLGYAVYINKKYLNQKQREAYDSSPIMVKIDDPF